jgi:hypothetical protein
VGTRLQRKPQGDDAVLRGPAPRTRYSAAPSVSDSLCGGVVFLPAPKRLATSFDGVQAKRRTSREFRGTSIDLADVATVLDSSFAPWWPTDDPTLHTAQTYCRGAPFVAFALFAGDGAPAGVRRDTSEPDLNLSTHPAPIAQPSGRAPSRQCGNRRGDRRAISASHAIARRSRRLSRFFAAYQYDPVKKNLVYRNSAAISDFQDVLARAARGRTVLVVAHRLATVIDCDRIVLLDEGRVVDSGRHAELFAASPLYRELAQRQLLAEVR